MLDRLFRFTDRLVAAEALGQSHVFDAAPVVRPANSSFTFRDIESICRFSAADHDLALRLKFFGHEIAADCFLDEAGFYDFAKIKKYYDGGATVITNQVHLHCESLNRGKLELDKRLSCDVNFNCYATPANCQGFKAHIDGHDVIILQLEGCKRWSLFGMADHVDGKFTMDGFDHDSVPQELTLSAGDLLYLPRGFIHCANSVTDQASLHLTIGFNPPNWRKVLNGWIDAAARADQEFQTPIPLVQGAEDVLEQKMEQLWSRVADASKSQAAAFARKVVLPEPLPAFELTYPTELPHDSLLQIAPGTKAYALAGRYVLKRPGCGRELRIRFELAKVWRSMQQRHTFRPDDLADELPEHERNLFCYYLLNNGFLQHEYSQAESAA